MKKLRIGVIPAAGKGKRMGYIGNFLPKSMLPIIDKPILEYVLRNMKLFGIKDVYIIVNYKKNIIMNYLKEHSNYDININYVDEKKPLGIAHAISICEDYINEPFVTILGDDFTIAKKSEFKNLAKFFFDNEAWVVEAFVRDKDVGSLKRTCCVILRNNKIERIIEKPTHVFSFLRGIGIYIFDPIVFSFIKKTPISKKTHEIEISDTINLIARYGKAYGYELSGYNVNVNTPQDWLEATRLLFKCKNKKHIR